MPNGDWAFPYLAHSLPHKYPRGQNVGSTSYAVWPKGRLVAVEAQDQGEFTMIPIVAPGKTLKINALTLRTGWVKVEVVGVSGRALAECIPIVGDQHWTRVTWKGGDRPGRRRGETRDAPGGTEARENIRPGDRLNPESTSGIDGPIPTIGTQS